MDWILSKWKIISLVLAALSALTSLLTLKADNAALVNQVNSLKADVVRYEQLLTTQNEAVNQLVKDTASRKLTAEVALEKAKESVKKHEELIKKLKEQSPDKSDLCKSANSLIDQVIMEGK